MHLILKHVSYTIRITKGQSDSKRNMNFMNAALILDRKLTKNTVVQAIVQTIEAFLIILADKLSDVLAELSFCSKLPRFLHVNS